MPGEIDLPIPDPGSLARGRFTYFPVVPGRLEFALEVRAAILRDRPEVVALELPATLQPAWIRAVSRLPEISVIFYPDENADDDRLRRYTAGHNLEARLAEPGAWISRGTIRSDHAFISGRPSSRVR